MNSTSVILGGANSPCFVNSQLVYLLYQLGFLTGREGDLNMTPKSPFGELSLVDLYLFKLSKTCHCIAICQTFLVVVVVVISF